MTFTSMPPVELKTAGAAAQFVDLPARLVLSLPMSVRFDDGPPPLVVNSQPSPAMRNGPQKILVSVVLAAIGVTAAVVASLNQSRADIMAIVATISFLASVVF